MFTRSQLYFHETFQPEDGYISKIIALAGDNFVGNVFEISEKTGIPTGDKKGKVKPHIKYAYYMGLIDYHNNKGVYKLNLTPLGNEIYTQDMFLHEPLTKWLCHYGIVRKVFGAPQWSFLINEMHSGFIQGVSPNRIMEQFRRFYNGNLSYEDIFGVTRRSYIGGFFEELEYLKIEKENKEFRFNEFSIRGELLYVYAYALMESWNTHLSEKTEITLIEVIDTLSFGKIFGFSDETVSEVLEEMNEEGLISLNRQLFPTTIIKTSLLSDLLVQLYSRLL